MIATTAALVLIAACGSSDGAKSTKAASTASNSDTAPAGVDATSAPGGGGSSSGGPQLPVQNATYGTGRVHVEFGGDLGGAVEIDGSGIVTNGFANFGFTDAANGASVLFAIGGDQGSVASFTYDGIASGGNIGKECSLEFTKSDATSLEASFTCTHMPGVSTSSTDTKTVDAKGTFRLGNA